MYDRAQHVMIEINLFNVKLVICEGEEKNTLLHIRSIYRPEIINIVFVGTNQLLQN